MSQRMEARAPSASSASRLPITTGGAPPGARRPAAVRGVLMLLLARAAETAEEPVELEPDHAAPTTHEPEPLEA